MHFMSFNAALMFFDTSLGAPPKNLRPWLLEDEKGEATAKVRKMREEGIHILSTFDWINQSKKATFWLRKDVIDKMR